MNQKGQVYWSIRTEDVIRYLGTSPRGLSSDEAKKRLSQFGYNVLDSKRKRGVFSLLISQFKSPIVLILICATGLSFFLHDPVDALIIVTIVVISGLLGFWQERGAQNAVEKLLETLQIKSAVLRDGTQADIPAKEIVPGDVVILNAGANVPADCLILESKDLFVNEAPLTGETYPVEKTPSLLPEETSLSRRVNSLIISASQGSEGMGFAIPSNMAKDISESLIQHGKVVRGYMGVNIQDITPEMAKSLKLKEQVKGAIVTDVVPGGPAEKAGVEQGDIIVQYNGNKVDDVTQLRNMVAATSPGDSAKVTVLRNNKEMELSMTVGDLAKAQKEAKLQVGDELMGVAVQKVTPQIAKEMGLKETAGVIITNVAPGSVAEQVGLEKGDIIYRVGNTEVNDPGEFSKLISKAAKEGGALLLVRDVKTGNVGYITVPLQ
ncbi:MAG: hypothetical protein AMS17_18460 [Spirochaetes bacterium DG_61]|jgi:hypothetical protein|nr:MAG: hypothetical protein AMS17_18460 [Spirochaetes bacterium DG_61]